MKPSGNKSGPSTLLKNPCYVPPKSPENNASVNDITSCEGKEDQIVKENSSSEMEVEVKKEPNSNQDRDTQDVKPANISDNIQDVSEPCETKAVDAEEMPLTQDSKADIKPVVQELQQTLIDSSNETTTENSSEHNSSAVKKAINQLEKNNAQKPDFRKKPKIQWSIKKKKNNKLVQKILTPKNAVSFLQEWRPDCTFKFTERGVNPTIFLVEIEHGSEVLSRGQGVSKAKAKTAAAENAIKKLITETLKKNAAKTKPKDNNVGKGDSSGSEAKESPCEEMDCLPWPGLASYAIHKMFSDWQSEGAEFSGLPFKIKDKSGRRDLPPNADKLHPPLLLNVMRPGCSYVELDRRINGNNLVVTVGCKVDGKTYNGYGPNKKEAKREAAQTAITALFGVRYDKHY